jgi:hypothetical protein
MDIKIVDNFLDPIDLKRVVSNLSYKEWSFQVSDRNDLPGILISSEVFLMSDVSDDEFFNSYLYKKLKEHLDGEYELERIYFNGQWSGRESTFHDDACDITALLYVSEYQYGWGGFTEIMTSAAEPTLIHPLQNRLCLFPGRIMHKGYSFSYQHCPMRISLAFKLNTK